MAGIIFSSFLLHFFSFSNSILRGYAKQTDLDCDSIPLNFPFLFSCVSFLKEGGDICPTLLWLQ